MKVNVNDVELLKDLPKNQLDDFLAQRSSEFSIILHDNELKLFKSSNYIKNRFMCLEVLSPVFIAVIYHDKDVEEQENQLKPAHYHICLVLPKMVKFKTLVNTIIELFNCNFNQIGIKKCNSVCMYSRYLCHLDDYDKHSYLECDVVTNSPETLRRYYDLVIVTDLHDLIAVVQHYNYKLEDIMCNIAHYDKWRKYVNDLIVNHFRRGL